MPSPKDLQQSGLKVTMPRMKILEVFEHHRDAHLTADDVYRILVTEGLDIGLATVYRALTQFEQAGLLQKQNFDLVITDIRMPEMDGIGLAKYISEAFPHIKIIILSGYNEFEYAKLAVKLGVKDYILKLKITDNPELFFE